MTRDDVIRMAREAGMGGMLTDVVCSMAELERFANLVAASERQNQQADIERWKADAATAEKWRGIACSKDGDGRTVQLIQQEAAAVEREACALVCEAEWSNVDERMYGKQCAAIIRARGAA